MNEADIVLRPSKIRSLLRQFCAHYEITDARHITPDRERDFLQSRNTPDSLLRKVGIELVKANRFKHLTNTDVECALTAAFGKIVGSRRSDNKVHIGYFNDRSLAMWDQLWLELDSFASSVEISRSRSLHPDASALIRKLLATLEEKASNNQCGFTIIIKCTRVLEPNASITVEDRITVTTTNEELRIEGIYKGSNSLCASRIRADLSLLTALLEYENVIAKKKSNQSLITSGSDVSISFNLPHLTSVAEFIYLKRDYEELLQSFDSCATLTIPMRHFYFMSYKFKRRILKTVIHFFHTDEHRLSSFNFLRYWSAIEVMLGSPPSNIKNRLKAAFYRLMPREDPDLFDKLWGIRNGIVHRGDLDVDWLVTSDVRWLSQRMFNRLLYRALRAMKT